jgi:chemotaxis protein MotB
MPPPARRSPRLLANHKPKYLQAEQANKERWLISYTDFVTILMILFVAIAAHGFNAVQQPTPPARPQTPAQPPTQPPAQPPGPSAALKDADQKLREQGLDSRLEKRGLVITLPQAILFPSGDDHIVPAAFPMLSEIAGVLASVPNKVALVGHADSVPIHNQRFQNNWELSAARSLSLLEALRTRYGIAESRLTVQSYGSYNPKDSNDTEAGRAENRRVEILLLDESAQ